MQPLLLHLKIGSWTILQNTEGPSAKFVTTAQKKICNLWKKWQIMTFLYYNKWTSNCIIVIDSLVCKLYSENLHFCNYIRWSYLTLKEFLKSLCENRRQGCWIKWDKLQININLFWDNVYSLYPQFLSLNLISYVTHVMIN